MTRDSAKGIYHLIGEAVLIYKGESQLYLKIDINCVLKLKYIYSVRYLHGSCLNVKKNE